MTFPEHLNKNPNPWEMRHADAGRLITLSSALLGITATFAQDFVDGDAQYVLIGGWAALIVAIVFSIFASGSAIKSSVNDQTIGSADTTGSLLNLAFWLLLAGASLIAGAGAWSMLESRADLSTVVYAASSAVSDTMAIDGADLTLLEISARNDRYELLFATNESAVTFMVIVDSEAAVSFVERLPS